MFSEIENGNKSIYIRDASGNVMSIYNVNEGGETQIELPIYGSSRIGLTKPDRIISANGVESTQENPYLSTRKKKFFEISNHLGNVLTVVEDQILGSQDGSGDWAGYQSAVSRASDYYPFGLEMPNRTVQTDGYRYGFNGKEKDTDLTGNDDLLALDYGFRIYNPAIGRFLSVDPLTRSYPMLTPYQFASNTPIQAIDVDGQEGVLGAIIGGGVDFIGQFVLNIALGATPQQAFEAIDLADVAVSAVQGFISPGGTITTVHNVVTKLIVKGAKELGAEIVKSSVDYKDGNFDIVGTEGSKKTVGEVLSEAAVNYAVNKAMSKAVDPISQAVSKNAKVNLRGVKDILRGRQNSVNKSKGNRKNQKIRRLESAQGQMDQAQARVDALESITPIGEVFGNGVKELAKPLVVAPVAKEIDEVINKVKEAYVTKKIIVSGDKSTIIIEESGTKKIFKFNVNSGQLELVKDKN